MECGTLLLVAAMSPSNLSLGHCQVIGYTRQGSNSIPPFAVATILKRNPLREILLDAMPGEQ